MIKHIGALRQTRVTYKAQNLYVFLENIDRLQSLRLQAWTDKLKDLEERYQECLHTMAAMFPKVGVLPRLLFSEGGGTEWGLSGDGK